MAAPTGRSAASKVDIQALVDDWAKDYFRGKATWKERRLLNQGLIRQEVDWRRVQFTHDDAVYEPEPPSPGVADRPNTSQNVLFQTTFANRTDREQTYTFRAERTTRSTCSVTVEQACTTGVEVGVTLTTPLEILQANAGFRREMSLTNSESETIEEELTWSVDSQVNVLGRHVGEAKLVIWEQQYEGRFTTKSHIRSVRSYRQLHQLSHYHRCNPYYHSAKQFCLSVCHVLVLYRNGLTSYHTFFTTHGSPIILVL